MYQRLTIIAKNPCLFDPTRSDAGSAATCSVFVSRSSFLNRVSYIPNIVVCSGSWCTAFNLFLNHLTMKIAINTPDPSESCARSAYPSFFSTLLSSSSLLAVTAFCTWSSVLFIFVLVTYAPLLPVTWNFQACFLLVIVHSSSVSLVASALDHRALFSSKCVIRWTHTGRRLA